MRAPARLATYQVKLPVFEGPLDLLLQMVQARKLDVTLVSLAAITGDFVARVKDLEGVRADELAGFLVVAAQLLAVKSRLLLPFARAIDPDEDMDADELVARLLEYQRFKEVAGHLATRQDRDLASFAPLRPRPAGAPTCVIVDVPGATALRDVLDRLVKRSHRPDATAPAVVARAWIDVDTCVQVLRDLAAHRDQLRFGAVIGDSSSLDRVVGFFLAVLHMWKWGELDVSQDSPYGDIHMRRTPSLGSAGSASH